ncbi:chitosanase [Actinomycetospora chiangmaiensis]|uniref:chitosanase n=1 Tax=Actinomycetospora chiangmaiensis TaxID=402650 RepID=UPI00037F0F03|nr:chitosanase [Actinomycetospora chiangmaiensis]
MQTLPRRSLTAVGVAAVLLVAAACGSPQVPAVAPLAATPTAPAPPIAPPPPAPPTTTTTATPASADLHDPALKDIAMQLVSSAENSSLDWRAQYGYLQDIGDGRGYTGGIIGFTSGTGDMLTLVRNYTAAVPGNPLAEFLPALRAVNGSDSHDGLGAAFEDAWREAATDRRFTAAQDRLRDSAYFDPAVAAARADGLPPLGQFAYYDAIVVHGPGDDAASFGGIRAAAKDRARTPAQGGDLADYLDAFWQVRIAVMRSEPAHTDVTRITDVQQKFAREGNYALRTPLTFSVYGDRFTVP